MANKIIELFNKAFNIKKESFQTEKIKDSEQSLEYSELAVDAEVFISTPTGSEPAPDGDYVLANNGEIKVANGKISEVVKEPADEAEPEVEVEAAKEDEVKVEDAPADEDKSKEAELQAKIDELTKQLEELKAGFSAFPTKAELAQFKADVESEIKKLENIPTEFSKVDNRVELADNPMAKYLAMAEKLSKN